MSDQVSSHTKSPQSQASMFIMCVLFGIFGIHRLKMGYRNWWLQAITFGGFMVWTMVDLLRIIIGSLKMADGRDLIPFYGESITNSNQYPAADNLVDSIEETVPDSETIKEKVALKATKALPVYLNSLMDQGETIEGILSQLIPDPEQRQQAWSQAEEVDIRLPDFEDLVSLRL